MVTFNGLTSLDSQANPSNCCIAAGPASLLTAVNWSLALMSKTGQFIQKMDGRSFFNSVPPGDHSDPRVLYHPFLMRFLVGGICPGGFNVGISKGPAPANLSPDQWVKKQFSIGGDYPSLGHNSECFGVTFASPQGKLLVFSDNLDGKIVELPNAFKVGGAPTVAENPETTSFWLVRLKDSDRDKLQLLEIENAWSTPAKMSPIRDVNIPKGYLYNNARQGTTNFFSGPPQGNAIVRDDKLYWSQTSGNNKGACTACVYKIDLISGQLEDSVILDAGPSEDCFNPAIAVDNNNQLVINYSKSGVGLFISNKVYQKGSGTVVMDSNTLLRSDRAGDYQGACVDPVDNSIWTIGHYASNQFANYNYNWATVIFNLKQTVTKSLSFKCEIDGKVFEGTGNWK